MPGLNGRGCSSVEYIGKAAAHLHRAGVRVAVFNPRGRGGNPVVSPFMYSAGYTEELRRVVDRVRAAFPMACLSAAGYSLGASYLAKYIGEQGDRCVLAGAACFACPARLTLAIERLGVASRSIFLPTCASQKRRPQRRQW